MSSSPLARLGRRARRALKTWRARPHFANWPPLRVRIANRLLGQSRMIVVRSGPLRIVGDSVRADSLRAYIGQYWNYRVPECRIVTVPDAIAAGIQLITIKDGGVVKASYLGEKGIQQSPHLDVDARGRFAMGRAATVARFGGKIVVIGGQTPRVYFHWLVEIVPALLVAMADPKLAGLPIVMRPTPRRFQQETLQALGLAPRFVTEDFVQADEIAFPSRLLHWNGKTRLSPEAVSLARKFARDYLGLAALQGDRRIYVSRGDASRRRVIGEQSIIAMLAEYGFEPVRLTEFSLRDQVALFQSASAVIGPHGSGLGNIVFCAKGTRVVEFFPERLHRVSPFWRVSGLAELDYTMLLCRSDADAEGEHGQTDMDVDMRALRQVLNAL